MRTFLASSLVVMACIMTLTQCRWLEVDPDQYILAEDALKTPEDLQALLVSCYDVLANLYDGDVQLINELRSDNTAQPASNFDFKAIYDRETIRWTSYVGGVNRDFFYPVLRVNSLLESFDLIESLTPEDRTRIEAEAKFVRAFCFWGAVKIFAQPYGYTSDNSHLGIPLPIAVREEPYPRSTVADTYAQIEQDLNDAVEGLPEENGVYATKDAAKALLASIHFLKMEYAQAAELATEVIETGRYQLEFQEEDTMFMRLRLPQGEIGSETIFGTYSYIENNDNRADQFSQWWLPTSNPELTLSRDFHTWFSQLIAVESGSSQDRRAQWYEYNATENKVYLKRFSEYNNFNIPLLHLTQMMLIRAEALAESGGDLSQAIADINAIRNRAGIEADAYLLSANASPEQVIQAARTEYRKETIGMGMWVEQLQRRGAQGEDIVIRDAPWDCPGMALQFSASEGNVEGFVFNEVGGCD